MGKVPVAGLTLLLGVDRFMSEARAITNLIGNGVATIVVSKWEKAFDAEKAERVLAGDYDEDLLPLADVVGDKTRSAFEVASRTLAPVETDQ